MAFCKNCGAQMNDGARFCGRCGATVDVNQNNGYYAPQAPVYNVNMNMNANPRVSTWDGGVFETVVNSIVASLIMTFTCGIATPWAVCYMMKFIIEHAVIDGKRMTFDGTGGQLFGNWIKWFLLTLITCGIYSFWVAPRLYKWVASHIHSEG